MRTGVELLKARAAERGVTLPENGWPSELFVELGLPIIVACRGCTMTMAFPSAKVDARGYTYCDDCAEQRTPDETRHKFTVELELSDRELLAITHDTASAGSIPNEASVASHVRAVIAGDLEDRLAKMSRTLEDDDDGNE